MDDQQTSVTSSCDEMNNKDAVCSCERGIRPVASESCEICIQAYNHPDKFLSNKDEIPSEVMLSFNSSADVTVIEGYARDTPCAKGKSELSSSEFSSTFKTLSSTGYKNVSIKKQTKDLENKNNDNHFDEDKRSIAFEGDNEFFWKQGSSIVEKLEYDDNQQLKVDNISPTHTLLHKRKRNMTELEDELNPKRKHNNPFNPQYSNDQVLSPIGISCTTDTDMEKILSSYPLYETPAIVSKFSFNSNENIRNSTPLTHLIQDKKNTQAKKQRHRSSLQFPCVQTGSFEISNEPEACSNSCSEGIKGICYSGFDYSIEDDDISCGDIVSQVMAVVQEGIKSTTSSFSNYDINSSEKLSKIDISEILENTYKKIDSSSVNESINKTSVELENNDESSLKNASDIEKPDSTIVSVGVSNTESRVGRFTNVEVTVSIMENSENEELDISEYILGLNDYSDNEDESRSNSEEDKDKTITVNSNFVDNSVDKFVTTDAADSTLEKSLHETECKHKFKNMLPSELETFQDNTVNRCTKPSSFKTDLHKSAVCRSLSETAVLKKYKTETIAIGYSEFDTFDSRLEDENELMAEVRKRWNSTGIPNPDVNLTVARTFRDNCNNQKPGILEGEKISCIDIHENNDKYIGTESYELSSCLDDLLQKKKMLEIMQKKAVFEIHKQLIEKQNKMQEQYLCEMFQLGFRQNVELLEMKHNSATQPRRIRDLKIEHCIQKEYLQNIHNNELNMLFNDMNSLLQQEIKKYKERSELMEDLLWQLQHCNNLASSSANRKYGPTVMVTLKKAPSKATNRKHSTVQVGLPVGIALAMMQEDNIYDHFYNY